MTAYPIIMASGLALCMVFAAVLLRRSGRPAITVLPAYFICAVSGFVFAKLFYVLPMASGEFSQYGAGALTLINAEHFSFFGGCVGVCVGFVLAGRLTGIGMYQSLDIFALPGTLLIVIARAAEYFLTNRFIRHGQIGFGIDLDPEAWYCFFPVAVQDRWDMPYLAIFVFEAVAALIVFIITASRDGKRITADSAYAGRFLWAAFLLMDMQIFLESLHNQSIRWGFVRVEQLACAVGLLALTVFWCVLRGRRTGRRDLRPVWLVCAMLVIDVGVEFALDKLPDVPIPVDYGIMILTLVVIGITGFRQRRLS
ncbi:MAG: prolipoprotein diacylglyceryl transferase [Clostridia bacterium]|nr:prolipoprotein diacylglyceryl transferase [Clostridia bacterium]